MADVARVDDEVGRLGKGIDLVDGGLKRRGNIRVGRFVESHVAVADLDESKFAFGAGGCILAERARTENSSGNGPDYAAAGPSHALQESAPGDTVIRRVVNNVSCQVCRFQLARLGNRGDANRNLITVSKGGIVLLRFTSC